MVKPCHCLWAAKTLVHIEVEYRFEDDRYAPVAKTTEIKCALFRLFCFRWKYFEPTGMVIMSVGLTSERIIELSDNFSSNGDT